MSEHGLVGLEGRAEAALGVQAPAAAGEGDQVGRLLGEDGVEDGVGLVEASAGEEESAFAVEDDGVVGGDALGLLETILGEVPVVLFGVGGSFGVGQD